MFESHVSESSAGCVGVSKSTGSLLQTHIDRAIQNLCVCVCVGVAHPSALAFTGDDPQLSLS